MILNDFLCDNCDKLTEKLVDANTYRITCICGGIALKAMGMPRIKLEGVTGDFPGAHHRWATIREDNARIKGKRSWVS